MSIILIIIGVTMVHLGGAGLTARGLYGRWRTMHIEKSVKEKTEAWAFKPQDPIKTLEDAVESFNDWHRAEDVFGAFCMGLAWELAMPIWGAIRIVNFFITQNPSLSHPELKARTEVLERRIKELEAADRAYRREHDSA